MDQLALFDRWIVGGLLLTTLFVPLVLLLIQALCAQRFLATDGGRIVICIYVYGAVTFTISWTEDLLTGSEDISLAFVSWLAPIFSVVFILLVLFGSTAIGRMGRDGAPIWIRLFSAATLFMAIPMGFAPIAFAIDGARGWSSVPQYYAEFVWRMADHVTFGYLSGFDAGGYSQMVVLTTTDSIAAVMFNLIVSIFVLSTIVQIVKPNWLSGTSFANRTKTESA